MIDRSLYQPNADIGFLALTLWREARGECKEAIEGVANVILNRVRKPSWWGYDVMSVIGKKWQFSSLTDPRDRQLTNWPESKDTSWKICLQIAGDAVNGFLRSNVETADSYFDISIKPPSWATPDKFICQLGRLRFYDVDRDHEAGAIDPI